MFQFSHLSIAALAPFSVAALLSTRACVRDTKPLSKAAAPVETQQVADGVQALHQGEINQGSLAAQRAATLEVRQFAARVVTESTHARDGLKGLLATEHITVLSGNVGEEVRRSANANDAALMLDHGLALDQDYLAKEVKNCEQALGRLDTVLIPNARNEVLRARLYGVTRREFQTRLMEAQDLQREIADKLALNDARIVSLVRTLNDTEAKEAEAIAKRTSNASARALARTISTDRQHANVDLEKTSQRLGVAQAELPLDDLLAEVARDTSKVNDAKGSDNDPLFFDTEKQEVADTIQAVSARFVPLVVHPALKKELSDKLLPMLQAEQKKIEQVRAKLGETGGGARTGKPHT